MRKITIIVKKEVSEYLERMNFELNFAKDVIQRIIESHPDDPAIVSSKTFVEYQKKGTELEAEYKIAMKNFENKYIPDEIKKHKYNWNLRFDTCELEITILCNCEIKGLKNEENRTV